MQLYLENRTNEKITKAGLLTKECLPLHISINIRVERLTVSARGDLFITTDKPAILSGEWIVAEL
jgi:hypothetical protein